MPKPKIEIVTADKALRGIMPVFLEQTRREIDELQKACNRSDYQTIRLMGHSLKGSSPNYGFHRLGDIGRRIEMAADEGQPIEIISGFIQEIIDHMESVEIVYK